LAGNFSLAHAGVSEGERRAAMIPSRAFRPSCREMSA
jgi:hypothetical protein